MTTRNASRSDPVPVHRMAVVQPFAHFLSDIGASVERGFRRARLPYTALDDVDHYVPSHRFWAFLVDMSRTEGIQDLGFRVGKRFGADSPDPQLAGLLQQAPTVYSALQTASEVCNRTISHCQVGILQPPNCDHACFYHKPSCRADHPAVEQIGWFGVMFLCDVVRGCVGAHWQPAEIGVMTHKPPGEFIREHFSHARLRKAQEFSYITLDKSLLSLPPLGHKTLTPGITLPHYESLPEDFVSSLEQIMLSYILEKEVNLDLSAYLCDLSKRSLQRQLTELGTSYSAILDKVRFQTASLLLRNPDTKITDIAHRLGYSDVAHFARAFRRLAGITPREFQQTHSA